MSDWKKMTKAQRDKRNARRRALHAQKKAQVANAAQDPAKKPEADKAAAPKKCACKKPCKACPKKSAPVPQPEKKVVHVDGDDLSLSENAVLNAVRVATDERVAIENAISRIGKSLLKLQRSIKPSVNFIKFRVNDAGEFCAYYGNDAKPTKKAKAKK